MKNTIKLLGIIVLTAIIGFSMIACNNGSTGGGGTNTGGNNTGGNNNSGGGGNFSSLIGTWEKTTGHSLKAYVQERPTRNIFSFLVPNSIYGPNQGDMYYEVTSYNGSTANLEDEYDQNKKASTITITVSGTTLTISGFTGSDKIGVDRTQFNGTYTKK
jgi:hypothetical protein